MDPNPYPADATGVGDPRADAPLLAIDFTALRDNVQDGPVPVVDLPPDAPVQFCLPVPPSLRSAPLQCVFYNASAGAWMTDGVATLPPSSAAGAPPDRDPFNRTESNVTATATATLTDSAPGWSRPTQCCRSTHLTAFSLGVYPATPTPTPTPTPVPESLTLFGAALDFINENVGLFIGMAVPLPLLHP